jgi:dTDP-4-dehydrorhamnose reductase
VVRLPLLVSIEPDDPAVAKMRAAASAGATTAWYSDEYRRPAYASEVAAALWRIVALPTSDRSGVWHLAGPERLSRYELATRVAGVLGLPRDSVGAESRPEESDRPRDIVFTDGRARGVIGWNPSRIG